MDHIIVTGVPYAQLLDDVRAVVRHEIDKQHAVPPTTEQDQLLTVSQAAELLDVCQATIHDWKKRGVVPYLKMGGRTYLKKSELMAALQGQQRTLKKSGRGRG